MTRIGSRTTGMRQRPQALMLSHTDRVPHLAPSSEWDGTAGSGFTQTPVDPTRVTAKPALRLMVPPNQHFTHQLLVGVIGFANANGTLEGGIDRVRFRYEGETYDIVEQTIQHFTRPDGLRYPSLGYWLLLDKPANLSGETHLYVEAIPADASMQSRVIGPYSFFPAETLHDYSVKVNSEGGEDYTTIDAALSFLAGEAAQNPLITITGGGPYQMEGIPGNSYNGGSGWCTITASTPVEFSRPAFNGDADSDFRPNYSGLHFHGGNITFDMRHVRQIRPEDDREAWFDRVRFTNSLGRANAVWRQTGRPLAYVVRGSPYFTECNFEDVYGACNLASLTRGCTGRRLLGDFAANGQCVVNNNVDDLSGADNWLQDIPALQVSYSGTEATASVAKSGAGNQLQTFTAIHGSTTATFTAHVTEEFYDFAMAPGYDATTDGQGYFVQDVADWLNSLPGWSATVLDNSRAAAWLSIPDGRGLQFSAQNAKNSTLELVRCFDIHGDFFQHRFPTASNVLEENVVCAFNTGTNMAGQMLFVSGFSPARDFYFVNNAFSNVPNVGGSYLNYRETSSQVDRSAHSNVVFAHNSMPTQRLVIRADNVTGGLYSNDSYCLISNNAFHNIRYFGTPDATQLNQVIKDNVIDGEFTEPLNATGTANAGDYLSKFADSVQGDFTPAGELLENARAPIFGLDLKGAMRGALAPAGALRELSGAELLANPVEPVGNGSPYDIRDMAIAGASAPGYAELISLNSIRAVRDTSGNQGLIELTGLPPGDYRITADSVIYDGTAHTPSAFRLRLLDNFTQVVALTSAGAVDETVTISSGKLRFGVLADTGFRLDDLFIEPA